MRQVVEAAGRFLICGDFNALNVDWIGEMAGPGRFGQSLLDLYQSTPMYQHVRVATRVRAGSTPSLLDLILTRDEEDIDEIKI